MIRTRRTAPSGTSFRMRILTFEGPSLLVGIDEVVALILPGNERSMQLAERLGMQYLGLTDRYYGIKAHLDQATR